jgi:hypothetical protein
MNPCLDPHTRPTRLIVERTLEEAEPGETINELPVCSGLT